ncbi:dipicolinate synthase [Thiocapsa imhoffii]|uniref:Dipicolinate synthase n=1 Tax=Thiocapsa imhoffii TaxID=382777 RepID=A0A9X0WF95_9GAMM|nr:AlpA family transcriptional regulator [Thiocapsa imhoffii]MBK1643587.1 dipicolinate synthase [Thiocapsa imhoffii]
MSATTRFIRIAQVCDRVGLKRACIYRYIKLGKFPAPVKLGPRASAWVESEVEDWQKQQVIGSRKAA